MNRAARSAYQVRYRARVHPPIEPFQTGRLVRPDGAEIYWEASGNPAGTPAVYLHGGPGGGLGGGYRRWFDPEKYLVVGLDQRGCGRSRPLVSDHPETLATNTSQALIEDLEALREHLGVERWLLTGASWGSTLALAYAQAHPDRVSEIALFAVTTTSRAEVDWITEHVGRVFPEAWDTFAAAVERHDDERVVDAYARVLRTGARAEREQAADAWDAWEATHVSLDPAWQPGPMIADPERRLVFATLVTHYWSNDAFLGPGGILDRVDRIAHLPAVLLHGRRDISGPAVTAWRLHQAWPASRLTIVEDEGHGGPTTIRLMTEALDELA